LKEYIVNSSSIINIKKIKEFDSDLYD
jgi:hypothetical protein